MLNINFKLIYIDDIMNLMWETVMIGIRSEWFLLRTNLKLHPCSAGPFKMLQQVDPNAYVFYLPLDFGISSTFNIEDLIVYEKPHPIPNDHFEMPPNSSSSSDDLIETSTPFTLISTQKDNIDAILDEQVAFTKNSEVPSSLGEST